MRYLQRHPFPVVALFEKVVAVSFAFPEAILRPLVPAGLEIDTHDGSGFVTVALVWTKDLRPATFPRAFGRDFFLAGYRIFTRLRDENGRRLRGLKILRSETDKRSMVFLGNQLTRYRYRRIELAVEESAGATRVETALPDGRPTLDLTFAAPEDAATALLPVGSPFADWHAARLFAGPMPFTFSEDEEMPGTFLVVQGSRESWSPRPVAVKSWQVGIFDEPPFRGTPPILANAFAIENVAYRWEKGRSIQAGGHK